MEFQLFVGTGAHQVKKLLKSIGHQVPARPHVKAEAILLPEVCTTAKDVLSLKQLYLHAGFGQQGGSGKTCDSASNNNSCFLHQGFAPR